MPEDNELSISLHLPSITVILEKAIFAGIIFILALPLLGDYGMWLFPIGRDIIFKLAVEFLLILFLVFLTLKNWKLFENWKLEIKNFKNPITLSILLFWLVMLLSALNSVQMEFSIWGNIYKNQGLMTWTHYVLFFFLLIGFLKEKRYWRFLIHISILIATLVGLIALWQIFQNGFDSRAASTLSNSNYLAAYLVLLLPVAFAFFLKYKNFILGSAVAIQLLALLFTQTRGGYFGIAVAAIIFAIIYTRQKKILIPALFITIAWLFLIFTPLGQSFQQKLPNFTDRFLNRQNIISDSGPRFEAWRTGWQGMLKKPLLGYGPENFFIAFDEHYSGSQDQSGSLAKEGSLWESWFDKAHNFIFDIGATMGFLGLLAYIAIFGSTIFVLLKKVSGIPPSPRLRRTGKYLASSIIPIGLIAAFAGYLVQNLLGFDTIVPVIYLIFFLAFANFITQKPVQNPSISALKKNLNTPAQDWSQPKADQPWAGAKISGGKYQILNTIIRLSVLVPLMILFILSVNLHINILRANHQLNLAEPLARNVGVEQAFSAFEKGLAYNAPPVNPNLRRRYAVIALTYYNAVETRCSPNLTGTVPVKLNCENLSTASEKYLARALELQIENATTEWPRFTRNYIYAAQISHILGDYENSDLYFEKALELSPGRISIQTEWSRLREERKE